MRTEQNSPPNLFADAAAPVQGERFETLCELGPATRVQIERIVSSAAPDGELYVQTQAEWVVLLRGRAVLEVDGRSRALAPGDHVHLPAGMPHRVIETDAGTVWLAVHAHGAGSAAIEPAAIETAADDPSDVS